MITSGDQNQFRSSFAHFGDLLEALMFLLNLKNLTLPLHHRIKGSLNREVLPRCGRKSVPSDSIAYSLSPLCVFVFALLVCFTFMFWVSLVLCIALFNLFLFVFFSVLVYFVFHIKKIEKSENTKTVCVCVHWYLCTLDGHWNKVF